MYRVLTLILSKPERLVLGANLSAKKFDERPSDTTLHYFTQMMADKFLYPEDMVIESHVVIEGSYVNLIPKMEVSNVA